jgi:hypothetical protein
MMFCGQFNEIPSWYRVGGTKNGGLSPAALFSMDDRIKSGSDSEKSIVEE